MRTITTDLYQYTELGDRAREYARERLRSRCYEANAEWTWEDANETIKVVEEVGHVYVDVQQSSQGFYANHYHNKREEYDLTDEEEFEQFRTKYIHEFKESLWCDHNMLKIVKEWRFDESRSYAGNVAWLIVRFCEQIYDETLCYFDDDNVEEWIYSQDFEFLNDGTLYQ